MKRTSNATSMDRENFASFPLALRLPIFPTQITNEEQSSRSISPKLTSSIADTSAAAAQNKKQYETLIKEEEKHCASLKWIF